MFTRTPPLLWWKTKRNHHYRCLSTTPIYDRSDLDGFWNRLRRVIEEEKCHSPHNTIRYASFRFKKPYIDCVEIDVISLGVLILIIKYAYYTGYRIVKFNINYRLVLPNSSYIDFTIGTAIALTDKKGKKVSMLTLYTLIYQQVTEKAEIYDAGVLLELGVRIFLLERDESIEVKSLLSGDEILNHFYEVMKAGIISDDAGEVIDMGKKKTRYPNFIPRLKASNEERRPFIVADIETVRNEKGIHKSCSVGLLVVKPGVDIASLPESKIETYFSEEFLQFKDDFASQSDRMMLEFINRLEHIVKNEKYIKTVYFHNFARFDGILLVKVLTNLSDQYNIKVLMRNNKLYELKVYSRLNDNKFLFRVRDSFHLLPTSLKKLAKDLCPQLGDKEDIIYEEYTIETLKNKTMASKLLKYMKQDIRLLGGIMQKAQDIYWTQYKMDITEKITLSSLALSIFRMWYYDPNSWPIYIPSNNQESFIRRGYYGGHADVYKPYGENLYYYDVNSLYPFIMKTYPMPGGVPVWHSNLEKENLENLFGFIEAYVVCPSIITRPFLPYKEKKKSLLFPTGKFVGVYYSEELIYAKNLGYQIFPLRGYLFEKKNSPFEGFVSDIFGRRQKAKEDGDNAMVYVYKILMNSLYGRFGINPDNTITEICTKDEYESLLKKQCFYNAGVLGDGPYYIVQYHSNTENDDHTNWKIPRLSAIQISAAITACARIHMYKYISRSDCYYTDTDSAILGSPLPDEEVSPIELGKVKLENNITDALFLAPKSYRLTTEEDKDIIKQKGLAKNLVDKEWFQLQYENPSRVKVITSKENFRISWTDLTISVKDITVKLGLIINRKRDPIFDHNNRWIDTKPKDIIDYNGEELTILKYERELIKQQYNQRIESLVKENKKLRDKIKSKDPEKETEESQKKETQINIKDREDEDPQQLEKNVNKKKEKKKEKTTLINRELTTTGDKDDES